MLMNKILRTELFNLLIEKSKEEVNNNVMQNAYDEFIMKTIIQLFIVFL